MVDVTDARVVESVKEKVKGKIPDYTPVPIDPVIFTADENKTYPIKKAHAIIFNHYTYDSNLTILKLSERDGTTKDEEALTSTLQKLGYTVDVHIDKKKKEIFEILEEVSPDNDCVAVCIFSHGVNGGIYAYDGEYPEKEILEAFKGKFDGKPKIFIFQMCRNNKMKDIGRCLMRLPDKDTIVLHSTYPEEGANRNTEHGTWFIQILCKRLNIMTKENLLLDEMIHVQRDVATYFEGRQMPMVSQNLSKRLFLRPQQE